MTAPFPARITQALDAPAAPGSVGPLEGPGVDEFCGVAEPTVDRWEAGEEIPTTEQLERLAELTGYPVAFFYREPIPLGRGFMCVRSGKGKGCHLIGDDVPAPAEQLDLVPASAVPARPARAPLPAPQGPGLPECSGPCGRPMRADTWRRQHGRCSRCGPA